MDPEGRARTRAARALAGALAAALPLAACVPDPERGAERTRLRVVGRVGGYPALPAEPPQQAAPIKLDSALRLGVRATAGTPFQVEVPPDAVELSFSTGLVVADGAEPGPARFAIEARMGGGWREVFGEKRAAPTTAWRDHRLDLVRDAPGARALRFDARPVPDGGPTPVWGSLSFSGPATPQPLALPGIVLICIDTLGASYLSGFDNAPGVSPNLDAFLGAGFSFRRAYAQYGNTLASHASLFASLYPVRSGIYPMTPRPVEESLVGVLARHGYRTVAFTEGGFVAGLFGFWVGFDAYDDGALDLSQQFAGGAARTFARAEAWLRENGAKRSFFLFLHTYEVHAPYLPRDEASLSVARSITPEDERVLSERFQATRPVQHNAGVKPLSERDRERLRALHSAEIHYADRVVGRFLERLDALGLDRHTLVIVTSDHGDQFGEHGKMGHSESLHNRVLHVPLGFRWPGVVRRGRSDAPVQLVDVMPTIVDLAGLPVPQGLDGRSLAPLLRGETSSLPERPAYSEQATSRGECIRLGQGENCPLQRFSVQTGRFKFVASGLPAYERLYDLKRDPMESRDVAAEHPEELARHRVLLEAYRAGSASAPTSRDAGAAEVDSDTRRRLRELGYAE